MDIEAAKKKVWETTAIGLPQVSAEANFQNFITLPTSLIPASTFNPNAPADEFSELQFGTDYKTTASISASQLIFDGSYIVGLQAAKAFQEISIRTKKKTDLEIINNVALAYHNVLAAIENQQILDSNYQTTNDLLIETKAIYEAGLTEEQNVDQLQLNLSNIESLAAQAKRQIEVSKMVLKIQLGIDISETISLTESLEEMVVLEEVNTFLLEQFKYENHIDYLLSQTNERLMMLSYRNEKYSFAPSVAAFFNHQQQNMNNSFDAFSGGNWYASTLWGISLKLPILTSGMRLAKMGQAKIEMEKAMNNSKLVEQNLILQFNSEQSKLDVAYNSYNIQKKNLDLSISIYNKTIKKYAEGVSTSLELTQSQTQMLNTEGKYIESILVLLNAKAALKKALGNN
jgi:outer membrane protein TolC